MKWSTPEICVSKQMATNCECPVCYEPLIASKTGKAEMTCGHSFHIKCLADWFSTGSGNTTCPMCRKAATDLEVPTKMVRGKAEDALNVARNYIEHFNSLYNNIIPLNNAPVVQPLPVQVRQLEDDAQVVATQAGVSLNVATDALQRANGDIVDAIIALTA